MKKLIFFLSLTIITLHQNFLLSTSPDPQHASFHHVYEGIYDYIFISPVWGLGAKITLKNKSSIPINLYSYLDSNPDLGNQLAGPLFLQPGESVTIKAGTSKYRITCYDNRPQYAGPGQQGTRRISAREHIDITYYSTCPCGSCSGKVAGLATIDDYHLSQGCE